MDVLLPLLAFLWSTVKYVIGVATAFIDPNLNHFEGFIITTLGGWLGAFVFIYGGEWIKHQWAKKYHIKKFTKITRRLVWIRSHGGLPSVAFLTPIFLSIPIGCMFAVAFENNRKKILIHMFISIVLWGILFFGIKWLFNINIAHILNEAKP